MKKMIYLCPSRFEKLNSYEKEHHKISYRTLINYYEMPLVLCNNIPEIDYEIFDNLETGSVYNEEENYYEDIFQYYFTDLAGWELDDIKRKYSDELIIAYSEKLDVYVLLVDHYGTAWDYVLTDIEWTTDYDEYKKWEENLENE